MSHRKRNRGKNVPVRHPMQSVPPPNTAGHRIFSFLQQAFRSQRVWISILQWLRNISFATLLLGPAVSAVAPSAFVTCTIAFYIGLFILLLDSLFLEVWKGPVKLFISAALTAGGICFWIAVVSHADPISFGYLVEKGQLDVKINNDSPRDDYRDVDLAVTPGGNSFIGEVRSFNHIDGCALISGNPDPDEISGHDRVMFWRSPDGKSRFYQGSFRIHCSDLPRMSHQTYIVQLVSGSTPAGSTWPEPTLPVKAPFISGEFSGKFKVFEVNQFAKSLQ